MKCPVTLTVSFGTSVQDLLAKNVKFLGKQMNVRRYKMPVSLKYLSDIRHHRFQVLVMPFQTMPFPGRP